jgi:hypothetical protein
MKGLIGVAIVGSLVLAFATSAGALAAEDGKHPVAGGIAAFQNRQYQEAIERAKHGAGAARAGNEPGDAAGRGVHLRRSGQLLPGIIIRSIPEPTDSLADDYPHRVRVFAANQISHPLGCANDCVLLDASQTLCQSRLPTLAQRLFVVGAVDLLNPG